MPNRIFRMTTTPYRLSKKSRLLSYRLPVTFVGSSCSWLCWSKTKIPAMLWDAGFALIFLPFSFFSGKSKGEGCSKGSCRTNIFPKHWRGSSSQRNSKAAAVEQQYPSMILNLTPSATNHSFEVLGAGSLYLRTFMSAAVLGKLALWQKGGQLVRNYDKFVNDKDGN